ncbi:MAG: LLM class flavin-dependent oxidoreductase, partial [Pirellulales bacterium]|nr:LLM class flavin-dependent oxidoreductase [Pirellulales bacterium]
VEIDVLSGGRLRLGIGIGWNDVEYQALGENFRNRGRRMEEQIDLLRKLWANEVIDYEGEWHSISDMGLNPLPGNRSIPLWGGAFAPPAIERVCRLLDGWFPRMPLDEKTEQRMDRAWGFLEAAGKKREDFGIDATIYAATDDVDQWLREAERWQSLGATHISFQTIGQGRTEWASHLEAIRKFKEAIGQ